MATSQTTLYNDPFLSDVTIRQICNGETKEYYGHKAVLCAHSAWFMGAFRGNFKEATDRVIELHDDDPLYFEVMMKYIYTVKWELPEDGAWTQFQKCSLLPIGVYALADKYGVDGLKARAVEEFCEPWDHHSVEEAKQLVEAHYTKCVEIDCPMGRRVAHRLLQYGRALVKSEEFAVLVKKYPTLAADVLIACPRFKGRLW